MVRGSDGLTNDFWILKIAIYHFDPEINAFEQIRCHLMLFLDNFSNLFGFFFGYWQSLYTFSDSSALPGVQLGQYHTK